MSAYHPLRTHAADADAEGGAGPSARSFLDAEGAFVSSAQWDGESVLLRLFNPFHEPRTATVRPKLKTMKKTVDEVELNGTRIRTVPVRNGKFSATLVPGRAHTFRIGTAATVRAPDRPVVLAMPRPHGHHPPLRGLLLDGVRDDYPAGGLLLMLDPLDNDAGS